MGAGGLPLHVEAIVRAEEQAVRGDPDGALVALGRVVDGAQRIPAVVAWRMLQAHFLKGDLDGARGVLARADATGADRRDRTLLHAWTAQVQRRLGDARAADAAARDALREAEAAGDDRAIAAARNVTGLALMTAGEHERAAAHLRAALAAAERAGDQLAQAQVLSSQGTLHWERSEFADGIAAYERAAEIADLAGIPWMQAQARMNLGLQRWSLGRFDEAAADFAEAIRRYRAAGSTEVAYAIVGKGDVHRERGEVALARAAYEEGLALGEASGDRQALVPALYQLAKVLVDDDPDRAERLARRAVELGWPDLPWALNALGWTLLARGEADRALATGHRAEEAARERHDRFGLAEALALEAMATRDKRRRRELLEGSRQVWREVGNVAYEAMTDLALARVTSGARGLADAERARRRLRRMGVHVSTSSPAGLLRFVAGEAEAPVEVRALGGLQVLRDGSPVPAGAWQSRRARDLLKILVARRGRPVPRETLLELLWPEEEADGLRARLSVALSTLRSVLDPGRRSGADHFVGADASSVWLRLEHVRSDLEAFFAAVDAAFAPGCAPDEARDLLEAAEAAYAGDLFEDDLAAEWAVALRERARAAYVRVAHALADLADRRGEHDEAIAYRLRVLERDPYDERAHRGLVAALQGAGRHGEARRAQRLYAARMAELGVPAPPFPGPMPKGGL